MNTISQDNTPCKQCIGLCGRILPATSEFFHRDAGGRNGLKSQCKQCRNHSNDVADGYKRCTKCKEIKLATTVFFSHNKQGKYGLQPQCKVCKNKRAKTYRSQPKVKELKKVYARTYARNHPLGMEAQARNLAQVKFRYHNSPSSREKFLINSRNRRSRKKEVLGTHTSAQIRDLAKRQKYRCYYCSINFEKRNGKHVYHVDHTFPISRVVGTDIPANDISYLVLTCPTCNLRKHDKYPWEFFEGGRLL